MNARGEIRQKRKNKENWKLNLYSVIPLLGLKYWDFIFEFYTKITNTGTEYSLQHWMRGEIWSQAIYGKNNLTGQI